MAQGGMAVSAAERPESFSFTLALVVPLAELQAWFDGAAPGAMAIYATGLALPHEDQSVAQVRRWIAAGEVETHQRRDPLDAKRWQFLMKRADTASARAREVRPDLAAQQLIALHRALCDAAAAGQPCPSRRTLAPLVTGQDGERAERRVRTLMQRLEAEGKIAVTPAPLGARHGPKVTILTGRHQGKATVWPGETASGSGA